MNERLTLQDLTDLLAQKQGITKRESESFLRELVAIISETIEQNETVKIKDFGTFKLVKVNARKSVDVNTGEDIEIPAHYKLSFTPDKLLKDLLNKPFAHFETIMLEEGVSFDSIEKGTFSIEELEDTDVAEYEDSEEVVVSPPTKTTAKAKKAEKEDVVPQEKLEEKPQKKIEVVVEPTPIQPSLEIPKIEEEVEVVAEKAAESEEEETVMPNDLEVEPKPYSATSNYRKKISYDDEFEESTNDISGPRRNYYVMGMIAVAVLAISFVGYRYYPDIKSLFEPEGVYYKPNAYNPALDDTMAVVGVNSNPSSADLKPDALPEKPVKVDDPKVDAAGKPVASASDKAYLGEVKLDFGQTLRQISLDYYKNRTFWVYIYEENKDQIPNPNNVPAGVKLRIPDLKNFGIDPKNPDDLKKAKQKESKLFAEFP